MQFYVRKIKLSFSTVVKLSSFETYFPFCQPPCIYQNILHLLESISCCLHAFGFQHRQNNAYDTGEEVWILSLIWLSQRIAQATTIKALSNDKTLYKCALHYRISIQLISWIWFANHFTNNLCLEMNFYSDYNRYIRYIIDIISEYNQGIVA